MSLTWLWIKTLLSTGLTEAAVRKGAEMLATARGWKVKEFADFVMFLYRLPADVLAQVESFIGHPIAFGAANTPPGVTDADGNPDPDLPECCNEFAAQIYMLRGAVMEEIADGEFEKTVEAKPVKEEKATKASSKK